MKRIALLSVCAVVCFWVMSSVPAQNLPKLSAHASSNRTLSVTWPYTNSGFALQESSALLSASTWQASLIVPAFDSNSAAFSVSVPATNAARYFRLLEPEDLRGVYVNTPLGGGPYNPSSAPVTNAINLPGMDGMFIAGLWSDIETNYNQYDGRTWTSG
jgi:hypothetical protein